MSCESAYCLTNNETPFAFGAGEQCRLDHLRIRYSLIRAVVFACMYIHVPWLRRTSWHTMRTLNQTYAATSPTDKWLLMYILSLIFIATCEKNKGPDRMHSSTFWTGVSDRCSVHYFLFNKALEQLAYPTQYLAYTNDDPNLRSHPYPKAPPPLVFDLKIATILSKQHNQMVEIGRRG